jgi:hypothetical protein
MSIAEAFAGLWSDARLGVRSLSKSPGFLIVVIVSLALGITANTTIFSVLNAVLYHPLPYPDPENLVTIWQTEQAHPEFNVPSPIAESVDWQKQNDVFEDISLSSDNDSLIVSGIDQPRPLRVQFVTPNFFAMLGAAPATV